MLLQVYMNFCICNNDDANKDTAIMSAGHIITHHTHLSSATALLNLQHSITSSYKG